MKTKGLNIVIILFILMCLFFAYGIVASIFSDNNGALLGVLIPAIVLFGGLAYVIYVFKKTLDNDSNKK